MDGLEQWLQEQFDEHKVEPNSGLGEAIAYMHKHWAKLTLFLRVARRAAGQQHLRTGPEEGDPASQERALLQDRATAPTSATSS